MILILIGHPLVSEASLAMASAQPRLSSSSRTSAVSQPTNQISTQPHPDSRTPQARWRTAAQWSIAPGRCPHKLHFLSQPVEFVIPPKAWDDWWWPGLGIWHMAHGTWHGLVWCLCPGPSLRPSPLRRQCMAWPGLARLDGWKGRSRQPAFDSSMLDGCALLPLVFFLLSVWANWNDDKLI